MPSIIYAPKFEKRYKNLTLRIKRKLEKKLRIFEINEYEEVLNNHQLQGEYDGCRSINITGDVRVIYRKLEDGSCYLITVGTHSQLYE